MNIKPKKKYFIKNIQNPKIQGEVYVQNVNFLGKGYVSFSASQKDLQKLDLANIQSPFIGTWEKFWEWEEIQ